MERTKAGGGAEDDRAEGQTGAVGSEPTREGRAAGSGLDGCRAPAPSEKEMPLSQGLLLNSPQCRFQQLPQPCVSTRDGPCQLPLAEVGLVHGSAAWRGGPGIWLSLEGHRCCRGLWALGLRAALWQGQGAFPFSTHPERCP